MTIENARALENVIIFMIRDFYDLRMISRNEIVMVLNNLNRRIVEELSNSATETHA